MAYHVHRALGALFVGAGFLLVFWCFYDPALIERGLLVLGGGMVLIGIWFLEQESGSRTAFGTVFTLIGTVFVGGHLYDPVNMGHDIVAQGFAAIVIGAWLLGKQSAPPLRREDFLGLFFLAIGAALLYSNWYTRQLESRSSLGAVILMLLGAHYLSAEKTAAMLKTFASYVFPWLRRNGHDRDPPPRDSPPPDK